MYGSYSFTRRLTDGIRDVSQQNFFETGSFTNNQNTNFYNQGNNHRAFFNVEYNLDSFNYIKISPSFSYGNTNNDNITLFNYLQDEVKPTSEGRNEDSTLASTPNFGLNMVYNHKFQETGS